MRKLLLILLTFSLSGLKSQIYFGAGYELPYQFKYKKGVKTRQNDFSDGFFLKAGIEHKVHQIEGEVLLVNWKQNEWYYSQGKKFTSEYHSEWLRLKLKYSRLLLKTEQDEFRASIGISISPSSQGGGEKRYIGDSLVSNINNGFATNIFAGSGPLIGLSYFRNLNMKKTLKAFGSIGAEHLIENEIFNGNRRWPYYTIKGNIYSLQIGLLLKI